MSEAPSPTQPAVTISGGQRLDIPGVIHDLREGLLHRETWLAFAWDEIQNRYRRSFLGLAWLGASYLLFVFAISIFFGGFSELGNESFVVHVAFGFAIFSFLLANITDGCGVFRLSAGWVKSSPLPYAIYVYKGLARALFPLAIQMPLAILVSALAGWRPSLEALLFLPALVLMVVFGVAVQYTLGLLAARLRDVGHLIQAISRLFFFTTPILWVYDETVGLQLQLANINPLTHFVEVARSSLIGSPPEPFHWWAALGWTIGAWGVLLIVGGFMRRKLPFWV